ncbi:hypothetical protein LTS10_012558 [Elasticomyces elasticus]|nr:hypothetical protein LTS10_012558 [Elasticomyces elasticus]
MLGSALKLYCSSIVIKIPIYERYTTRRVARRSRTGGLGLDQACCDGVGFEEDANVYFKAIRSEVAGEEDEIIEGRTIGGVMQNSVNAGGVFTPFQKLKYYQNPSTKSGQKLLDPVADAVTMRCSDDFAIVNYINPEREIPNVHAAAVFKWYDGEWAQPANVWKPKYEEAREVLRRLMVEAMGDMKANNDYAKLRRDDRKDHVLQFSTPNPPKLTSKAAKPRQKSPKKVNKNTNNRSVTLEVWIPLRPVRTEQIQLVEIAEGETRSEILGSGRQVDLRNLSWAKFMDRVGLVRAYCGRWGGPAGVGQ